MKSSISLPSMLLIMIKFGKKNKVTILCFALNYLIGVSNKEELSECLRLDITNKEKSFPMENLNPIQRITELWIILNSKLMLRNSEMENGLHLKQRIFNLNSSCLTLITEYTSNKDLEQLDQLHSKYLTNLESLNLQLNIKDKV
jgi:hypothetical protein